MCGISAILMEAEENECPFSNNDETKYLFRRGPDCYQCQRIMLSFDMQLILASSVLHMRGEKIVQQPAKDDDKNLLLWNGEIFGGLQISSNEPDTTKLLQELSQAKRDDAIVHIFEQIQGPWSFIYWQGNTKTLWFGRDIFGRRSLLWGHRKSSKIPFALSSVSVLTNEISCWEEVPCKGIYSFYVGCYNEKNEVKIRLHPWEKMPSGDSPSLDNEKSNINWNITVLNNIKSPIMQSLNKSLPTELDLEHYSLREEDKREGEKSNSLNEITTNDLLFTFQHCNDWKDLINNFAEILSKAVKCRVKNHSYMCSDCIKNEIRKKETPARNEGEKLECKHASVAVLFSGGLDSAVIAALAHRYIPEDIPIDLLNVAFEHEKKIPNISKKFQKRKHVLDTASPSSIFTFDSPDRISGINTWKELQNLYPKRIWNFVEINVTKKELQAERERHIRHLIYPSSTVIDDSIGCACWFASEGSGNLPNLSGSHTPYTSPARVLLVGMGADEQLAGYSRHRNKFNNYGWNGLLEEIGMEIDRISSRNLGRDDRVISDHGKESRYPFLDENVVSYLNTLPIWLKANLSLSRGRGEKILLRLLAEYLGLKSVAQLPKRAIQFGSRIAHSEDQKEKGSDTCQRLNI